jgi:hypothetical protein
MTEVFCRFLQSFKNITVATTMTMAKGRKKVNAKIIYLPFLTLIIFRYCHIQPPNGQVLQSYSGMDKA